MDFEKLVNDRYSCKKYSDKKVDRELITKILEIGSKAPTAKNFQCQRIYVLESDEYLAKIDSLTPCRYNAPVVLVVAYDKSNVFRFLNDKGNSGIEDVSIIATHMMLAATSLGVDSCWINYFNQDEAKKVLGLPENEEIVLFLDLGYASEDAGPLPNHFSRKDLKDTVSYK